MKAKPELKKAIRLPVISYYDFLISEVANPGSLALLLARLLGLGKASANKGGFLLGLLCALCE